MRRGEHDIWTLLNGRRHYQGASKNEDWTKLLGGICLCSRMHSIGRDRADMRLVDLPGHGRQERRRMDWPKRCRATNGLVQGRSTWLRATFVGGDRRVAGSVASKEDGMQILTGEPRLCAGVDQLADPGRGRGQTRR